MDNLPKIAALQKQSKKVIGKLNKAIFLYSSGKVEFEFLEAAIDEWINFVCDVRLATINTK